MEKPMLRASFVMFFFVSLAAVPLGMLHAQLTTKVEKDLGDGWELPFPDTPADIPEPVLLQVTTTHQPNKPGPLRYIPSQKFAPNPNRLLPILRNIVTGIHYLSPDRQLPVQHGICYVSENPGSYWIHHRRAGARCLPGAVIELRMERFYQLAVLGFGVRSGETFARFDTFTQKKMEVFPGQVRYFLTHDDLKLDADVVVISPASVPAYGVMARIRLFDRSGTSRKIEFAALASKGKTFTAELRSTGSFKKRCLTLETPRENPPALYTTKGELSLLHDTRYRVMVGLDGDCFTDGETAVVKQMELPANGEVTVQLTAFIDSPGYDEKAARKRLETYFNHNMNLPEYVRRMMVENALDTFARIVSGGDKVFTKVRSDGGKAFDACVKAWEKGIYRDEPVSFEMSDKKLESLAHLMANDLLPGLVQPPGLVHDAKTGDTWGYIFCYRHVHAASDLGLEDEALNYLRLLSANQQEDGKIASLFPNFLTPGHGTLFDESYIDALYHYYKWTGDLEAVRQLWPTVKRAAEYLDNELDPDSDNLYLDLIHQWKSDYDNRGPSSSFQTALVRKAYADMAEFAELLGMPDEAQRCTYKAKAIYDAAHKELWSDEMAMLGPKCPLGILRLHPQTLEVEIPIWTKLVDEYQAEMLADWYLSNLGFSDEQGGLWMYDNDWWPVVWSQHMGAPGDYLMVGWALFLTGHHEEGYRVLKTVAESSYRGESPGFNYTFDKNGIQYGRDPATVQGAFGRTLIEGLYGVIPNYDKKRVILHPRFPSAWNHARLNRRGLDMTWNRSGTYQTLTVKTPADVRAVVELPVNAPVARVTLDCEPVEFTVKPGMRHGIVALETKPGGGTVAVTTENPAWNIKVPPRANIGGTVVIEVNGIDEYEVDDRYRFFEVLEKDKERLTLKLTRSASGRAAVFLRCRAGNLEWVEPVTLSTLPATPKDIQARTVLDPLPEGTRYVPVDLSKGYNDDIQRCFSHRWKWDAYAKEDKIISYWTMPLFVLSKTIPQKLQVGKVPFLLGPMGPGEAEKSNDLLMLANTPPHELPASCTINVGNRRLHKFYMLSLNMNLPQKCYVPTARIVVHYTDGGRAETELIAPLNFDSFFQDYAVNTMALPLPAVLGYGLEYWPLYFGADLRQHHLTMTDIICDPLRTVSAVEIQSIATETFLGLAGLTLVEAL